MISNRWSLGDVGLNRGHVLFKKVKNLFARVTGFSSPFFGLSWNSTDPPKSSTDVSDEPLVLTVSECAKILRLSDQLVLDLLESGELGGLLVKGEWRVVPQQLISFLSERVKSTQLAVLSRRLQDPKVWKKELEKDPEFKSKIQTETYPENSFGRFLQDALALNGET